jgi:hypothetical protein
MGLSLGRDFRPLFARRLTHMVELGPGLPRAGSRQR